MDLETPNQDVGSTDPTRPITTSFASKELVDSDDECVSVSSLPESLADMGVGTPEVSEDASAAPKEVDELKFEGNRLFGLGRYAEAVEVYERGLAVVQGDTRRSIDAVGGAFDAAGMVAATLESNIAAVRTLPSSFSTTRTRTADNAPCRNHAITLHTVSSSSRSATCGPSRRSWRKPCITRRVLGVSPLAGRSRITDW